MSGPRINDSVCVGIGVNTESCAGFPYYAAMHNTADSDRLRALIESGIALTGGLELEQVLTRLVRTARSLTDARYGALGVLDEEKRHLSQFITDGMDDATREAIGALPTGRGILGVLIRDARPVRLDDLGSDPRSIGFPDHHPPMHSFLGVPVLASNEVFGNLYLTEKRDGVFTEEDEQLAVMLAAQAGVAIQNARLFEAASSHAAALEQAWSEVESVDDLLGAIVGGRAQDEVLRLLAGQALRSLGCAVVAVALPTHDRLHLRYVAAAGAHADRLEGHEVPVEGSKAGAALMARRTVWVEELDSNPDAYRQTAQVAGVKSVMIIPLVHRFTALGVLMAGVAADGSPLGPNAERLLQAYAARAVLVTQLSELVSAERERGDAVGRLMASEAREESRRETLRRVVDAQEEERRRLAIELHDETGQSLATVLMGLRRLEDAASLEEVRETAAELRETVQNAVQELRALAVELRPKALDDFGLGPALERLVELYGKRTGTTVTTHLAGLEERLPGSAESALYRIAQEGLTNITKHAGATNVSLVTRRDADRMLMMLVDDGEGFDTSLHSDGLGLLSIRERAELLGGSVTIESESGKGTTVAVEIPT